MNSIWIHRHIHKTGGTSVRNIFLRLAKIGAVVMNHGWMCTSNFNTSVKLGVCVFEMHEGCTKFNTVVLPNVERIRISSPVFLTTFIREPFDHSISAWLWAGKPSFGKFNRTISYWLPWNMQSNQLLYGDFDHYFMGNKYPKGKIYNNFNDKSFEKLLNILVYYDIICPTNTMVVCIQYILRKLNLPIIKIPHIAPRHGLDTGRPVNHTEALIRECKHIDCKYLIKNRTQYDKKLFKYAQNFVSKYISFR